MSSDVEMQGIARQHGPGVNATVQAQLGAGTEQDHERRMCSGSLSDLYVLGIRVYVFLE